MDLVAYLRHSKRDKNGQSLSFEYQFQQIKRFISSQEGWRLVRIFKDDGYSGALPVEKRPGLKALQEYCKNHRVKKVIVFKLDRLFREARLALNFAWELGEQEIGLVAAQEIIDTSTPWGKFSRYMQIGVAELERDIISTRTIAALNVKKERLEHLGHVPFGFTRKLTKLKAWVRFDRRNFEVTNDDDFTWHVPKFTINAQIVDDPYIYQERYFITAGETKIYPAREFTNSKAQRFDPWTMKPMNFTIECGLDSPHDRGHWFSRHR